jgi:uncharacterized membrane protein YbaN (DUF454 family)
MEKQKMNTTVIYILAIVGFLCCCFGGLGVIPAAIAFFMANGKVKEYNANPENYENGKAMNTAKIIALVVLIINVLYLAMTIYRIATIGWDEMMLQSQDMMEQYGM